MRPESRPAWYDPTEALLHAGELADTAAGRNSCLVYVEWMQENEAAQRDAKFAQMSKGWVIGSREFKRDVRTEHRELGASGADTAEALAEARELRWEEAPQRLRGRAGRRAEDLAAEGKSAPLKIVVAAMLKQRAPVTNRWLGQRLHSGNLYEVSRKISAWQKEPEAEWARKLGYTPNPKALPL